MDNRFGIKDAALILLLVIVIAMLGLKMVQDDRQWKRFGELQTAITEQTRDTASMRRLLQEGIAIRPSNGGDVTPTTTDGPGDPFARIKAARQAPDYAQGDWMVEAFGQAVPKVNELTSQDTYSRVVYSRVMESLLTYDIGTREQVPLLAERWEVADDGLSATFYLRKNVKFSDGTPLTADDVVYTFGLIKNPEIVDGRLIQFYRNITGCDKIDNYTVRFTFEEIHFQNLLRASGLSIHSQEFLSQYSDTEIREHPALLMGTGPYRLPDPTQYTPGGQIEVVRNERYWGVPGPWERIVWKIIESEGTEGIAFRNGDIDFFGPTPEQHLEMLEDQALLDRTQHYVYEQVRSGYTYMAWNQKRGGQPTVYADKRVRQALTMLIDRQRIAEEIFLGFASVANGPFHHLGPQADPSIEPWPYDSERAVALLKEAGFSRDSRGVMLGPDGEPFEIDITYPAGSDTYQKVMLAIKDGFSEVGINFKLNPQKWVLLLETLNNKDFDAIALGWGAGGIEGDIEQMFHTRTIAEGDNRNAYSNPELDALIEQAHITLDFDERMAIWRQAHAVLHEDQPYTFLMRYKSRLWLDDRIANVKEIPVLGVNYVSTWPVPIEWYVPADQQKYSRGAGAD